MAERAPVFGASQRAERTGESLRSEAAYRDWNALPKEQRPLAVARDDTAKFFDRLLYDRWHRGDDASSNIAIADRYLGCAEKTVRQWRDGEKPMPLAALLVLPPSIATELISWVQDKRALTPHRRGLPMLEASLDRLEQPCGVTDREEVARGLRMARDRIIARLDKLATEGK